MLIPKNNWGIDVGFDFYRDIAFKSNEQIKISPSIFYSLHLYYNKQWSDFFVRPGLGVVRWEIEPKFVGITLPSKKGVSPAISVQIGYKIETINYILQIERIFDISENNNFQYGLGIEIPLVFLK